jgi:hypothetical protein
MRFALLLLAGISLAVPLVGAPAQAATLRTIAVETNADDIVEPAAVHCGRHAHYIRGHRARNGQWIRGRCVRNRPR